MNLGNPASSPSLKMPITTVGNHLLATAIHVQFLKIAKSSNMQSIYAILAEFPWLMTMVRFLHF
jgi:hypothetical protein